MRLTPAQIAETKASYLKHGGNYAAVARELGLARSTVQHRIAQIQPELERESVGYPAPSQLNDDARKMMDQFTEYLKIHGCEKPRIRVKAVSVERPSDEPIYRVMAIGDAHEKPGRDKERFKWFSRMAASKNPHAIVSIGDWASLDSLSTHEMPGSANDADRPSFHVELESLEESLSLFHSEIPVGSVPVYQTMGNHEYRTYRAANRQPKLNADMPVRLEQVFARFRWDYRAFGEALELYGVDFVHCYLNKMGREVGGDNLNLIANKCSRSVVMGHTHVNGVFNQAKYGHSGGKSRKITVVNLGTSMPYGTVERYSGLSSTGWGYGVYMLRIQDGVILSAQHHDMLEIEELYGR